MITIPVDAFKNLFNFNNDFISTGNQLYKIKQSFFQINNLKNIYLVLTALTMKWYFVVACIKKTAKCKYISVGVCYL